MAAYGPTMRPSWSASRIQPGPAGLSTNCQRHTSGRSRCGSTSPNVTLRSARIPAASSAVASRVPQARAGAALSGPAGMTGEVAEGRGLDAAARERILQLRIEQQLAVAVPVVVPVAVASLGLRVRVAGMEHHLDDVRAARTEMVERREETVPVEPAAGLEEADGREAHHAAALGVSRPSPRARRDRI